MSRVVSPYSGDILKFAGDALWVYTPMMFDPTEFMTTALEELKSVNDSFQGYLKEELSIHVGAELGSFQVASLGISSKRLEAEPLGKLVNEVFNLCDKAVKDEIAIGPEFLKESCQDDSKRLPCWIKQQKSVSCEYDIRDDEYLCLTSSPLEGYLPIDLVQRLTTSKSGTVLQSEHREVVVIFALIEIEENQDQCLSLENLRSLNQILVEAFGIVKHSGGSIARIDPYKAGHKLLILFGAPKKNEHDLLHAIVCGKKLAELNSLKQKIKLGMASGPLFCGSVGATKRIEYTVMGEAVNIAARLMSKSEDGSLLLDNNTRGALPGSILTEEIKLPLKGFGSDILCHRLTEITQASLLKSSIGTVVGQSKEMKSLVKLWEETGRQSGRSVQILGSAGVGKSYLIERFIKANDRHDFSSVYIPCKETLLHGRGWLISELLKRLLSENLRPLSTCELSQLLSKLIDKKWQPLFTDMLGKEIFENEWTKGISPTLRLQKTVQIIMEMLSIKITDKIFLILDDYYLADEFSIGIINGLVQQIEELPLLLILIRRELPSGSNWDQPGYVISINNPTHKEWQDYFKAIFKSGVRENELLDRLLEVSSYNAQFITSAIKQWEKSGLISLNPVTRLMESADSATDIVMPDNLHDLCLEEFDRLPEKDRELLKIASIAGMEFSLSILYRLLQNQKPQTIDSIIAGLVNQKFLMQSDNSGSICFSQSVMRDAIYNCIPDQQLKELHSKSADLMESIYKNKRPDLIAYHYSQAGHSLQTFSWALKAAVKAVNAYSLVEAAQLFKLCDSQLEKTGINLLNKNELLIFFKKSGEAHLLDGRIRSAYRSFRRWRHFARHANLTEEYFLAVIETARLMWRQSKYNQCQKLLLSFINRSELENHTDILASSYAILAEVERRQSNFQKAQEYCNISIEYAGVSANLAIQSEAYNKLGLACWGAGELAKASESYLKSLKHKESINGMYAQAQADNNLGIIYWEMGHLNRASNHLRKSLGTFKEIGDQRNEAYSSGNLANIYRIGGKFCKSEELLKAADLIFEKLNDSHAHQYTIGNLGDLSLIFGDLTKARDRFNEVSAFAESIGDKELAAECLVRLADVSFFERDYPVAQELYTEGYKIARSIGSQEYVIRAKIGLARLAIGEKQPEQALGHIESVEEIAISVKAILPQKEALFLKGELLRISGQLSEASACYNQVLQFAKQENVFELCFKCSIRLIDIGFSSQAARECLSSLRDSYISENGESSWNDLMKSAYFSFFPETLSYQVLE